MNKKLFTIILVMFILVLIGLSLIFYFNLKDTDSMEIEATVKLVGNNYITVETSNGEEYSINTITNIPTIIVKLFLFILSLISYHYYIIIKEKRKKFYFFPNGNLLKNLPTIKVMSSHLLIAIILPIAFPPTVKEDTIAVKRTDIRGVSNNITTKDAEILPDTIPQISPIRSLQTLLVLLACLINFIHSFDPVIFLEALAWNVASSQLKTATPIISNIIPTNIITINKIDNNKTFIFEANVEMLPNMNDNIKVSINIIGSQLSFFIYF